MANVDGNWPGILSVVHRWANDYSKPGAEHDFIPQNCAISRWRA